MKKLPLFYTQSLLPQLPAEQVAYFITAGEWVPVLVGETRCIPADDLECPDCPLAAYSHMLVQCSPGTYRKYCTVPFVRDGKVPLKQLMNVGGCGAKDGDYRKARRMFA